MKQYQADNNRPAEARPSPGQLLLVRACALAVAGVGLVALLGWALRQPLLASLGSGRVPVAPSTAGLFLLYALAVALHVSWPEKRQARWLGLSANTVGALVAAVLLLLSLRNIRLEAEHLGFVVVNRPGEPQAGHMSPITAGCFLVASLTYYLSLAGRWRWAAITAWWLACGLMATGSTLVLAYFYGTPILYGSDFIPPAALTSVAFMALGTALLSLAAPRAWPFNPRLESSALATFKFVTVFVLLTAGIVIAGFLYYRTHANHFRSELERQLTAIGDLKADELVHWRQERLGDAALFYNNPDFSGLVRRYLRRPDEAETAGKLQLWLQHVQASSKYDQVLLLDGQGRQRLAPPTRGVEVSSHLQRRAAEALAANRVGFEDFYRNEADGRVYLALLVPILEAGDRARPLGTLVLRIDPERYLYPFLQRWPTPSQTAETLLVRREGAEVLFLNELRFQPDSALNLRRPLAEMGLPAAEAVRGRQGVMEGRDYRGVPVIADLRPVPESPWFLVSRMDLAEVYGPMRENLWLMVILIGALIVGAGGAVGGVWRRQRTEFYREKYEAAEALRASEDKYRLIAENTDDLVYLVAPGGQILYISPSCERLTGYSPGEFLAHSPLLVEIGHPADRDVIAHHFAGMSEESGHDYLEYRIVCKSGEVRWISHDCGPVFTPEGRYAGRRGTNRNITGRKLAEEELLRHVEELKRSNEELQQFAYVASHDLQEPLRMVSSFTQLLAQRYEGQLDDRARKYINYAVDGALRMQLLINDLLAFSRIGTRGKPLAPTDTQAVLAEAVINLKMQIDEAQALISSDPLPEVRADASQLVQLFQNLIGNGVKFRGSEPPQVHLSAREEGREWLFSVRDNGIGIEPEYADKVFVIFQRLHTREEYPGSGIGLAICKKIVERHGGRIWFDSVPGQGTTFYFTLPK